MYSNLSPYLIEALIADAERRARRPRLPGAPRRRLPRLRLPLRRPRGGRPDGRIAPA